MADTEDDGALAPDDDATAETVAVVEQPVAEPAGDPPNPADPVVYAVLTQPRGGRVAGTVVFAPQSQIAALIAAEEARDVLVGELDQAAPFHYPLPAADAGPILTDDEA